MYDLMFALISFVMQPSIEKCKDWISLKKNGELREETYRFVNERHHLHNWTDVYAVELKVQNDTLMALLLLSGVFSCGKMRNPIRVHCVQSDIRNRKNGTKVPTFIIGKKKLLSHLALQRKCNVTVSTYEYFQEWKNISWEPRKFWQENGKCLVFLPWRNNEHCDQGNSLDS